MGKRKIACFLSLIGHFSRNFSFFASVLTSQFMQSALFLIGTLTFLPLGASASDPASPSGSTPQVESLTGSKQVLHRLDAGVEEIRLENGLRILFFKRDYAPVFAGQTWVKVGGVNELPGNSGAAHLLEHMAFKGTTVIGTKDYAREKELLEKLELLMTAARQDPKSVKVSDIQALYSELSTLWVDNEFSRIYQKRGAVGLNAATAKDYTMYQVELPSSAFELWCWMESERLLHPVFRQFYKELEVVKEERRMRSDDDPHGKLYEALLATAYWNHPYRFPTIGWPSDLKRLTSADTQKLYQTYYRPDNMVIALVGDLQIEEIRPLLKRYFGRLPKAEGELPVIRAIEEEQTGPREAVVRFDAQPTLLMGYHKPVFPNHDDMYFSLLHSLLGEGRSSLLYRELVLKRQLAVSVGTSEAPGELYPSLFFVAATPRQGVANATLMTEIQKIFDKLQAEGFSEADFLAAKKRVKVGFLHALDSNEDLAETLAHDTLLWQDWRVILEMYDLVENATREDVQSLLKKYLHENNRTYVHLEKPTKMEVPPTKHSAK